jgi:hypothetical protein
MASSIQGSCRCIEILTTMSRCAAALLDTLEPAIRHASAAGVILAPAGDVMLAANAPARHLLDIRDGPPGRPLGCAFLGEIVRAARESQSLGRPAWFAVDGDVIEVRADRAGPLHIV